MGVGAIFLLIVYSLCCNCGFRLCAGMIMKTLKMDKHA